MGARERRSEVVGDEFTLADGIVGAGVPGGGEFGFVLDRDAVEVYAVVGVWVTKERRRSWGTNEIRSVLLSCKNSKTNINLSKKMSIHPEFRFVSVQVCDRNDTQPIFFS